MTNRRSSDVCKLRIDFDTMVLADPFSVSVLLSSLSSVDPDCFFGPMFFVYLLIVNQLTSSTAPVAADGIKTGNYRF